MRVYSDILKKPFDTEKECKIAEQKFLKDRQREARERETQKNIVSKEKKELAAKIEQADKALAEANEKAKLAREKANEVLDEANKQISKILNDAREEIRQAEKARMDAIVEFTDKFGAYTTSYSGEAAIRAYNDAVRELNNIFTPYNEFFSRFFGF